MLPRVVAFLCVLNCVFCGPVRNEDYLSVFESNARRGVEKLFKTGIVDNELKASVGSIGLEHFFDYNYAELIDPQLICTGCGIVLDAVISSRRNGTSEQQLGAYLVDACSNLYIQPREICQKLIDFNMKILLYIIDNMPELKGMKACSIIFQDFGCKSDQPPTEWAIKIHEGPGREGTPGNGVAKKILHITDIHYDPEYSVGSLAKCRKPLCCQKDSGVVLEPEHGAGYWGDYNKCDSPRHTVVNSLNYMARVHNDLEYVYFTGDIMSHRIWSTSMDHNSENIVTILNFMKDAFGDIPVFPILGNHEPHPLNVWATGNETSEMSSQWLFDLIADQWTKWLPENTKETIKRGGFYTVLVKPGFRIIAINSNVAYTYNWWLIFDEVDPYGQLEWMEKVLHEAEQNGESVHVLSHVPSGDDTCYIPWSTQFRRIIRRYSGTITGIFNGHTHKDEFILYADDDDKAAEVAWNGGSFTPFTNNNPNYRVLYVDEGSSELLDFDEYIFNVTEANLTPELEPNWFKLYSFKEAYGVKSMQARDIHDLTMKMAMDKDKELLKQYKRFISREGLKSNKECNEECLKKLLCRALTSVKFDSKYCNQVMENWS